MKLDYQAYHCNDYPSCKCNWVEVCSPLLEELVEKHTKLKAEIDELNDQISRWRDAAIYFQR